MENLVFETKSESSGPILTKFLLADTNHVLLKVGGERHQVSLKSLNKFPTLV